MSCSHPTPQPTDGNENASSVRSTAGPGAISRPGGESFLRREPANVTESPEQTDPEIVILTSGKLPALKEQFATLEAAGVPAQIVQPPEQAANG